MECPICGQPTKSQCECPRQDSTCANGHHWHQCLVHHVIVVTDDGMSSGEFHSLTPNTCTCLLGNPFAVACKTNKPHEDKTVYIASSWKNHHAVRMLTVELRRENFIVDSFLEIGHTLNDPRQKEMPFEEWLNSDGAEQAFRFDTQAAMNCDAVVYLGPAGIDAWAEIGAAFAKGRPLFALYAAKGEQVGLMRKMIPTWCETHYELIRTMKNYFAGVSAT